MILDPLTAAFDIAAFKALLGNKSSITNYANDDMIHRSVKLACIVDTNRNQQQITLEYTLQRNGFGKRIYPLCVLNVRGRKAIHARTMQRLAPAQAVVEKLMNIAQVIAKGTMPEPTLLRAFLPVTMHDLFSDDLHIGSWPKAGLVYHETIPAAFWPTKEILYDGKINASALCMALNLAPGEQIEMLEHSPAGDYRVFYMAMKENATNSLTLNVELLRGQHVLKLLALTLSPVDAQGLCTAESLSSDAQLTYETLKKWLPNLAHIVSAIRAKQRPSDALLLPLLSHASRIVWQKEIHQGASS